MIFPGFFHDFPMIFHGSDPHLFQKHHNPPPRAAHVPTTALFGHQLGADAQEHRAACRLQVQIYTEVIVYYNILILYTG